MFKFDDLLVPVWDTDIVYGESFTMYRTESGEICAPFLFTPKKVIKVETATQETLFEEGKDWYVKDNMLYLTENTKAPFMEYEELFHDEEIPGKTFKNKYGKWITFREGHFFHDRQIAVTYECEKGGWKGYVPQFEGDNLPKTMKKLKEDKMLRLSVFGDSISEGSSASGKNTANPFQPRWAELFAEQLRRKYDSEVKYFNPSLGGKDSKWGIANIESRVMADCPDLIVLAFGMNGGFTADVLKEDYAKMIEIAGKCNPDVEFILVATSTPNPDLVSPGAPFYVHQHEYKEALDELNEEGIVVANIRDVQKELHSHKRFIDTTGNNVNHPNDFFIRIHAQVLASMLIK